MLDTGGRRVAGQADGEDAQGRAGEVEGVVGQVLAPVGRDAEPDADAGDQRDRRVDDQQPLPPDVGQRGAAEHRAEDEAGHADDHHHGDGAHPQRLVVEEPEDQRVGDRRHRRGGDAERGPQGDQLAGVLTATTHRLIRPNAASPTISTRRRPKRSATDPAVSSRPPKVSE